MEAEKEKQNDDLGFVFLEDFDEKDYSGLLEE